MGGERLGMDESENMTDRKNLITILRNAGFKQGNLIKDERIYSETKDYVRVKFTYYMIIFKFDNDSKCIDIYFG